MVNSKFGRIFKVAVVALFSAVVIPTTGLTADKEVTDYLHRMEVKYLKAIALYAPGPYLIDKLISTPEIKCIPSEEIGNAYFSSCLNLFSLWDSLESWGLNSDYYLKKEDGKHFESTDGSNVPNIYSISNAKARIIQELRVFVSNPYFLKGLWLQSRLSVLASLREPSIKKKMDVWLPSALFFVKDGGFDPSNGRHYEDWRSRGCIVYFSQEDYLKKTEISTKEDHCRQHELTMALGSPANDTELLNRAWFYGFLWRRYIEGGFPAVEAWQGIIQEIAVEFEIADGANEATQSEEN